MSATTSAATGRRYGIQRVCQAWDRARASLYARQTREHQRQEGQEPARRGPKPTVSDAQLLAAIHTDLARSPFRGEGHRKVHARLRIMDDIRVARKRVLRVIRAHGLLSPHRGRQGGAPVHDGTVVTQAPNVMWGTDGVRVFTLDDGWVWIFAAVEHWNAECVGWHVCKIGSRFAHLGLEPTVVFVPGIRRAALQARLARGEKLIAPQRGPRRRDPQLPRHRLEILTPQQAEYRRAFTPGRKPPLPVTPGGPSGRPPGSLRRRRLLIVRLHLDTPPASTLSQSSVQENPGAPHGRTEIARLRSARANCYMGSRVLGGKNCWNTGVSKCYRQCHAASRVHALR